MSICLREDSAEEEIVSSAQTSEETQWKVSSYRRGKLSRSSKPQGKDPSGKGHVTHSPTNKSQCLNDKKNGRICSSAFAHAKAALQLPATASYQNSQLTDQVWPVVAEGQKMHALKCNQRRTSDSFAQKLQTLKCWSDSSKSSSNEVCSSGRSTVQKLSSDCFVQTDILENKELNNMIEMSIKKTETGMSKVIPALHESLHSETQGKVHKSERKLFTGVKSEKLLSTQKRNGSKKGSCPVKFPSEDYRVRIIDSDQKLKYEQSNLVEQAVCEKTPPVLQLEKDFPDLSSALRILSKCIIKKDASISGGELDHLFDPSCSGMKIDNIESKRKVRKRQPRRKDPISLNIIDIIKESTNTCAKNLHLNFRRRENKIEEKRKLCGNLLDSSNPIRKRGKHRENPPKRRLSKLKNVIMNERQRKREQNTILSMLNSKEGNDVDEQDIESCIRNVCNELSSLSIVKEGTETKAEESSCFNEKQEGRDAYCEADDNSLNRPMELSSKNHFDHSLEALTTDVESSCILSADSPDNTKFENSDVRVIQQNKCKPGFHSRKFREYCDNMRSQELDLATSNFLKEVYRFQDRHYQKDPIRAHAKRRFVLGIREVKKFLTLKKLKSIVIAPDLEPVKAPGGLDETILQIRDEGRSQQIPVIFAVGRRQLGFALMKKVPISIVGIINPEGAEELYHSMLREWRSAMDLYRVKVLEFSNA